MKVLFKRLDEKAQVPVKKRENDFCYDCYAVSEEEIAPNVWRYGLGFALQPYSEYDGSVIRDFTLRPRSSIWEHGMMLANSPATCDEPYTGEIKAIFYHIFPNMPRYKVGERVCQLHVDKTDPLEFVEVNELRKTDRGDKGFGSSGK